MAPTHTNFQNPEEQFNFAVELLTNAYEAKSEYFENELKKLNETFEAKLSEYEKGFSTINEEKEQMESTIENLLYENKKLSEKIETLVSENKKLEKFKESIMTSINTTPSSMPPKYNSHNTFVKNALNIKNTQLSSRDSNTFNAAGNDNRIENLIEKLNDSINNRIYPSNINDENIYIHDSFKKEIKKASYESLSDFKINKTKSNTGGLNTPTYYDNKLKSFNDFKMKKVASKVDIKKSNLTENIEVKSTSYALSSKFFAECRIVLKQEEYNNLIEILRMCNNNKIDKDETFRRIEIILKQHLNLLKEFRKIFNTY